jgi:hypothetical protein
MAQVRHAYCSPAYLHQVGLFTHSYLGDMRERKVKFRRADNRSTIVKTKVDVA